MLLIPGYFENNESEIGNYSAFYSIHMFTNLPVIVVILLPCTTLCNSTYSNSISPLYKVKEEALKLFKGDDTFDLLRINIGLKQGIVLPAAKSPQTAT